MVLDAQLTGEPEFRPRQAAKPLKALAEKQPFPELMTALELRQWLKVSKKWVAKYTTARRIPGAFQVGKPFRYERAAIEKNRLATGQVLLPAKGGKV